MKTLVLGASGATGKLLVDQLLKSRQEVTVLIRPTSSTPQNWKNNKQVTILKKNIAEISLEEMSQMLAECDAVASCLGHNLTWQGIYGKPRKLVADAVKLVCLAILNNARKKPIKIILMNTAGHRNPASDEAVSLGEKSIVWLIRVLLPPHADNEQAADYLRIEVGQNHPHIEWVVVRPDTLINQTEVSKYSLHKSPTRSAIFNPGTTSRINVGHLMAKLILDDELWRTWQGQMPVLYNQDAQAN